MRNQLFDSSTSALTTRAIRPIIAQFFPYGFKFGKVNTNRVLILNMIHQFLTSLENSWTITLLKMILKIKPYLISKIRENYASRYLLRNRVQDPRNHNIVVSNPGMKIRIITLWFRNRTIYESKFVFD